MKKGNKFFFIIGILKYLFDIKNKNYLFFKF